MKQIIFGYYIPFVCQTMVFVLSKPVNGAIGRISGTDPLLNHPARRLLNGTLKADAACQLEARKMGLHGTYVAVLSSYQRSVNNLLYDYQRQMPVINAQVS